MLLNSLQNKSKPQLCSFPSWPYNRRPQQGFLIENLELNLQKLRDASEVRKVDFAATCQAWEHEMAELSKQRRVAETLIANEMIKKEFPEAN